jgi:hypothetical protein
VRRTLAVAAAASLLAAAPAAAEAKPLRFAAKCGVKKKKRSACRAAARAKGWRAAPAPAAPLGPARPLDPAHPLDPAAPVQVAAAGQEAPGAATPPPDGGEAPAAPLCDPSPWLGAIAEDVGGFRLRLTRTCVPAGTILFQFRNNDLAFHNIWAEGSAPVGRAEGSDPVGRAEGSDPVGRAEGSDPARRAEGSDPARPPRQVVEDTPGETTVTRSAQLTAGRWRLYCSLPGHEAMSRLVDVTPAG